MAIPAMKPPKRPAPRRPDMMAKVALPLQGWCRAHSLTVGAIIEPEGSYVRMIEPVANSRVELTLTNATLTVARDFYLPYFGNHRPPPDATE